MRTVTFKSVLHFVAHKMGLQPAVNLTNDVAEALTDYINFHLREAWERDFWPELMAIEERATVHRPSWDAETEYAAGDEVRYEAAESASEGIGPASYNAPHVIGLAHLTGTPNPAVGKTIETGGERYTIEAIELLSPVGMGSDYHAYLTVREAVNADLSNSGTVIVTLAVPRAYWRARAVNTAVPPPSAPAQWEGCTVTDRFVPYEESGATPLGTVQSVWKYNRRYRLKPPKYEFLTHPDGIVISPAAPETVWVEFRRRPAICTSTAYLESADYTAGERVYDPATGECYRASGEVPPGNPPPQPTYWEKIDFPAVLAGYVQKRTYAEALEEDGQQDKAAAQIDAAEELLAQEWSKAEGQQGQIRRNLTLTRPAAHP